MNEHLSRREFLETTGKGLAALSVAPVIPSLPMEQKPGRPNLVFIFSDQHSRDMLGCYGNEDILTPNLDRFAQMGSGSNIVYPHSLFVHLSGA